MKKLHFNILICTGFLLLLWGCNKDNIESWLLGNQPTFISGGSYNAGLNILGVIRPDSLNCIHVEKVIPAISETDNSFSVDNYSVIVYKINHSIKIDSLCYKYQKPDTLYTHKPVNFKPVAENIFQISCQSEGFPVLTSETIIPNQPVIVGDNVLIANEKVQFSIASDATTYLYDIYLVVDGIQYSQRIVRASIGTISVKFDVDVSKSNSKQLIIYAYDKNLSNYLTEANLFAKPNTYRPPFSTVQNGYGCFGSLNLLSVRF